jgi:hypothetical protein
MTLQSRDIRQLIVYGSKLWGHAFPVPVNEGDLAVTEQAWNDVLSDLEPEDVRAAMADWSGQYPPTPKQLRNETEVLVRRLYDAPDVPEPDQAYAELIRAVSHVGYVGIPQWSHYAVAHTVEAIGGWQSICESTNEPALRAHFMQMYASASRRAIRQMESPLPVIARRKAELDGPRRMELPRVGERF